MSVINSVQLPHDIVKQATELLAHSYAPYSKFHVASIVKARGNNRLFYGCNVENASFGATICAERNAISNMILVCGQSTLEWVVVMSTTADPVPPCGMCLQVIAEFGSNTLPIYLANPSGIKHTVSFADLLPHAFREFT